jgi:FMN phosphatase YigB (HAD superfamily)
VEDQVDYCEGAEALGIRALRIEREGRDPDLDRQPVIGDLRALLQLV